MNKTSYLSTTKKCSNKGKNIEEVELLEDLCQLSYQMMPEAKEKKGGDLGRER